VSSYHFSAGVHWCSVR